MDRVGGFPLAERNTAYDDYKATASPDPLQTSRRRFLCASNARSQGKTLICLRGKVSLFQPSLD